MIGWFRYGLFGFALVYLLHVFVVVNSVDDICVIMLDLLFWIFVKISDCCCLA